MAGLKQRYSRKYIVKRLIGTVIVYFAAVILIFAIEHLMPGNIAYDFVSRLIAENPHISYQQALQEIEAEYGLNLPIYDQFLIYIRNVLFTFPPNFGTSFEYLNDPAMNIVLRALPFTLLLIVISQLIAWGVSIFIGVELAIRKNKKTDKASVPLLYFIYSIPIFWLALIMILVFSLYLHIFPAIVPFSYGSPISTILYGMTLPIIVVVISTIPNHTLIIYFLLYLCFKPANLSPFFKFFSCQNIYFKNCMRFNPLFPCFSFSLYYNQHLLQLLLL